VDIHVVCHMLSCLSKDPKLSASPLFLHLLDEEFHKICEDTPLGNSVPGSCQHDVCRRRLSSISKVAHSYRYATNEMKAKLYVKNAGLAITRVTEPRTMTEPCGAQNQGWTFVQKSLRIRHGGKCPKILEGGKVTCWEFVRSFGKD
jgi:hypothetical protein